MGTQSYDLHVHIAGLRRYAIALAGNPSDADDLVQETLRRAIVYAQKGGQIQSPRAFLFTVLHNVWASNQEKRQRHGDQVSVDDVASQLRTEGNQHTRAELNALLKALRELPHDQRQVVLLVCLEGFAYRETAETLGVPIGTVMSRLSRARKALVDKMTAEPAPSRLTRVK